MAKIRFGMMMTDARNKLGGQVFSSNRGGSYIRTLVIPKNPRSVAQQQQRYYLSNFSKSWKSLSQTQIASWVNAVANWAKNDVFAQTRTPTGKNLYTKLNINLANIGVAAIDDPPTPASLTEINGFGISAATPTTMTLAWSSGAIPAAENWLVSATKCMSSGAFFLKNQYRVIENLAPATATGVSIYTAYAAKFGAPIVGDRIGVQITQIDNTTGTPGIPIQATIIVT